MRAVYVAGVGAWAPGYRDAGAVVGRRFDPAVVRPDARVVPPALRRGASLATCMALEVLGQAGAEVDLTRVATIFASAQGELRTAVDLLDQLAAEGVVSPLRFRVSVHNAPGGLAAIALGNRAPSTALSAGDDLFVVALREAAMQARDRGSVVLVLADEALPERLAGGRHYDALAVALHLTADPAPGDLGMLSDLRRGVGPVADRAGGWAANPCAPALAVVEALLARRAGPVAASLDPERPWTVSLTPAPARGPARSEDDPDGAGGAA